ncbi:uncharacterized protein LOC106062840 isoform X1 [Biomphalaria glabrata]|uniref:Uncharacterized protein LOC106062840 isoform X1 n=2 Tax=Biomphalaria glabrata TaxID=6526 RepID=A0A9W3BJC6_BIOGL|nr:uncharacterized protein LOC106062840 isoform X1 [Biomphalaria glabrata]
MSRSSFGLRRSFNSGRKLSREHRKDVHSSQKGQARAEHNDMHEKRQRSRHDNRDTDKATRSIFGDVPLTDTERRYLWAAQSGNLTALEMLVEDSSTFNLSCRDYLGRTALQLAVLGEHYDCIQLLLDKSRLDIIEEGLLHAIKTENVKICDMFLAHPVYSDQRSRMQLEFQHGFYEQEDSSSSFAPDITPIVLAAQCNNFDIVHMLIQKGFTISTPHNYFCLCTECYNHKTFDRVVHSKSRLNAYRGLASTAYLALSCDDPIYAAFELSRSLQKLADREKEHKSEYRGLSEKCKNFAVDLLDQCRTNEEVMAALHGGTNTRNLSRIKMAIRYEQKKFIANASCQEHLASMWYAGASWFQHQNFPIKLVLVPLGIVFIPVTAIVYVFLPYSRIGKILKSPFMKFMNYICSYTAFLVLLFLGTQLSSFKSVHLFKGIEGVVNGLIMFYVLGMFWAECKQLWEEGVKGYFSQMWNYMDITMLALYTAGYSTEGVIYTKTNGYFADNHLIHSEDESILNPQILSKVLFSVANVMSFARIAYILPASETFGQLQISYGRMLQDVGKFIFIYFTVMIAFICGLTSLYSISKNENFAGLLETTGTLFWAAFGMGNSQAPAIKEETNSSQDNGDSEITDSELLKVIEVVGYILYGVYILGAVVVLINMLIAMMSNTFEDIQKSEDCEWKFARAKLWISFIEQGTTLPIPFNIIPTPKSVVRLFRWFQECISCQSSRSDSNKEDKKPNELEYKAIMHRVVLRYIHKMKFEKKGESIKDDLLDTREEVIYQLHSMYGRLAARLELLEKDVFLLAKHGWEPEVSPNHSSLYYSRSVPSHPGNEGIRSMMSDNNKDPFLFRRRSYYHERPRARGHDASSRLSLEERMRKYSETESRVCFAPDSIENKVNMSDGDKRNLKNNNSHLSPTTSIHNINLGNTVTSSNMTTNFDQRSCDSRKESVVSNLSQNVIEPEEFCLSRRDSFRVWPQQADIALNQRVGGRSREDSFRHKSYSTSPRWNQGVIKESSLEDQINTSTEQQVTPLASDTYHVNSNVRKDFFSYPNIDAPFGPPSGEISQTHTFAEYHETKQKRKEAIESLVLDVHQIPFTKLDAEPVVPEEMCRPSNPNPSALPADNNVESTFPMKRTRTTSAGDTCTTPRSILKNDAATFNPGHDSDNEDQYAAKISSVSLKHVYPRQGKALGFNTCKSNNPVFPKCTEPTFSQLEPMKPPLRVIRKLGHVNHVYVPDRMSIEDQSDSCVIQPQINIKGHANAISTESQIFYTKVPMETKIVCDENTGLTSGQNYFAKLIPEVKERQSQDEMSRLSDTHFFQPVQDGSSTDNKTNIATTSDQSAKALVSQTLFGNFQKKEPTNKEYEAVMHTSEPNSNMIRDATEKHDSIPAAKHSCFVTTSRESNIPISDSDLSFSASDYASTSISRYPYYSFNAGLDLLPSPDFTPMVIPALATNLQPFPLPTQGNDSFVQRCMPMGVQETSSVDIEKENTKRKSSSGKKTSLVSFVRGRRSDKMKGKLGEEKPIRSVSLNRSSGSSRRERLRTLQTQRSKEV